MDPCPFVRLTVGNLALKIPVASRPSLSVVNPSLSPCFCKIKLKNFPLQTAVVPCISPETQFPDKQLQTLAATFHLGKADIDKLAEKSIFSAKPRLKIAIYTGRRGTWRLLGKVSVPLDLAGTESRACVFLNGWIPVGKEANKGTSAQFHLNVKAEPDPRFVFQFDGEPECSPQVFLIQGNIRQPVFTCKFSFRNIGDRNQRSRLSYQRNGKVYLLTDNEDVERFIAYISVSQDDVTLYVVEPRSSIVGSVAGSNQLSFSQNPQPFSNPNPNQLSAPNSGFRIDQLDDDEPTEKIVSTSQYSKFGLGQYPDFDIGQYTDFDDVSEEETDHEEVTTVNEHVEHPFCNSYNPEEEKEEEKVPEEKKMPREYNWNMPELLQLPEEELAKKAVDCYTKVIRVKKDDCFDTKEDLKIALYTKCVEDGYQLKVNKSSKDRFETRVYRGHEIMTDMNARFKISISYSQAWRAKCYALELLRGSPEASFAQLPAYCHNLKLKNPGSVTHIKTDRDGRFELLFIAIGATIRSFITCMRPVIIVDGAHLKGRYLGVNLLAVAMDANNGILPIAYGVGKSETSDSWTWFMGHLRDCIGPISNLTIISDRANSIDNAVRRCFPDAFHGLCGVHLYRNLKSRSAGIKKHKWTYWKAVKAYREVDFNKHINCLRRVLPQCAQTLEDVGFERWSRVHQLGARYGFMTSNSAESINALSRHSRKLPITMLMEFFRASIQQWYYKKRNHAGTLEHRVTPWTEKKITKRVVKSTSWRVEPCSNTLFQVLDNNLNGLVDLNAKTCSCMKWQTSGYPCGHVIKVALHLNQDDSSAYAMDCYTTEVYRQTYAEIVYPIPHPSEWDIPDDLQTVLPPAMDRRLPGRPKSHDRIPSKGEEKKRSTCSRCKESGHTRLTCGSPVPSKSSFPLPKYGSSSKSKAHMVSSKRQSSLKSQSRFASPFETVNLGDF
ncbi:Ergosterol28 isoform 1 [Hibiscus syriacus]|uniref:Ergosterol28 isoform 1 n=1 Tax=Hibiscus syriacus TaxID=106335 RepID=A0A6A2WRK1_HIBSY|nr:Ergosterol28 isoform 1 [Hibiscus syriacus]